MWEFPENDLGLVLSRGEPSRHEPSRKSLAAANVKVRCKTFCPGFPRDPADWQDFHHDLFLDALLRMEAEERLASGILGRWPLWEIRKWAIMRPEAAERIGWTVIVAAGILSGALWHVLSPHVAWLGP